MIFEAISLIQNASCIRFVPLNVSKEHDHDHLESHILFIGSDESGCQSYVGKLGEEMGQPLKLFEECEVRL